MTFPLLWVVALVVQHSCLAVRVELLPDGLGNIDKLMAMIGGGNIGEHVKEVVKAITEKASYDAVQQATSPEEAEGIALGEAEALAEEVEETGMANLMQMMCGGLMQMMGGGGAQSAVKAITEKAAYDAVQQAASPQEAEGIALGEAEALAEGAEETGMANIMQMMGGGNMDKLMQMIGGGNIGEHVKEVVKAITEKASYDAVQQAASPEEAEGIALGEAEALAEEVEETGMANIMQMMCGGNMDQLTQEMGGGDMYAGGNMTMASASLAQVNEGQKARHMVNDPLSRLRSFVNFADHSLETTLTAFTEAKGDAQKAALIEMDRGASKEAITIANNFVQQVGSDLSKLKNDVSIAKKFLAGALATKSASKH